MSRRRDEPKGPTPLETLLTTARQQWKQANEAEEETRREGETDLKFLNLDQWPQGIKDARNEKGRERPCLTIDQIGEPYRQLTNKQRESRPAIHVTPEDGLANDKTAEVFQGLIRTIEYQSDAQIAYATAFEGAVGPGWGYARLLTEYEGDDSFAQVIKIAPIENQFSVYIDPAAKEPDRRDMRYAYITEDMPLEKYRDEFPQSNVAKAASLTAFAGIGDAAKEWFPDGNVRVAERYYLDFEESTVAELPNGQVVPLAEVPDGVKPAHQRTIRKPVVKWLKMNAVEILEGNEDKTGGKRVPGTSIPIRPCYGQVLNINGKRIYRGIVRAARDPQQMYNYMNSSLVEDQALSPKSIAIGAEGQFEGHEDKWNQIATRTFGYVEYRPTSLNGTLNPPPGRLQGPDPAKIQSTVIAINQAKADLRSTTGWYDATDPSRENTDQSGRAILARKESQGQSSINYLDNLNRFLTSMGKLLIEWIPEVYVEEGRIVRILSLEDQPKMVMLNQPFQRGPNEQLQPMTPEQMQLGAQSQNVEHFDLKRGKYGIRATVGASFTTRKQEAADWQFRIIEANPAMMGVYGDIAFKNLDGPGHLEISERIGRTIPPQIKGDDQTNNLPPEAQQQIAAAKAKEAEMMQVIQGLQKAVETDQVKLQGQAQIEQAKQQAEAQRQSEDNQVKWNIAQLNAETDAMKVRADLIKAKMTIDAKLAEADLDAEIARLKLSADLKIASQANATTLAKGSEAVQ